MIKNLKDKRTMLEKDIEEESVDIKNLKEKLQKVSEYIDEENRGIQELSDKRMKVENEAATRVLTASDESVANSIAVKRGVLNKLKKAIRILFLWKNLVLVAC